MKKYYISLVVAVFINGCGENSSNSQNDEPKERIDLVSYLPTVDMVKEFKSHSFSGGATANAQSTGRSIETITVDDENIHYIVESSSYQGGISNTSLKVYNYKYTDKKIIMTSSIIPGEIHKERYVYIESIINKTKSENNYVDFRTNGHDPVGKELTNITKTCEYEKLSNIDIDDVNYEGNFLRYTCSTIETTQYKIDTAKLLEFPDLKNIDGKYSIEKSSKVKILEKNIGVVQSGGTAERTLSPCEKSKCNYLNSSYSKIIVR